MCGHNHSSSLFFKAIRYFASSYSELIISYKKRSYLIISEISASGRLPLKK
nr:MAG TPA: hypothetical protein [Caudoviricetes sp.]